MPPKPRSVKARSSKTKNLNRSLPTTSQLHLFCTTWSLLRTILDPASWWLSQSCDSYAAAFCCRDVGPNGPNATYSKQLSGKMLSLWLAEPSPLSTVWLGQLQKQIQSRSRGEATIGINLHPGKRPNNRHQGNHSRAIAFHVWTLGLANPLQLSAWAWLPSTNCRLLSCSQNLMCYPWVSKCIDQSRWSPATVTSGHSHPSILGAAAIVEYQP